MLQIDKNFKGGKKMLRWDKKRKGFTLIELVIVIAILGILAMYALPKYQGIVKEARSSEARAQLGSFRSALGIYYAKNHGKFPAYKTAALNYIFADDTVPKVEVTTDSNGTIKKSNAVEGISSKGTTTEARSKANNDGGWYYDVSSDKTKAAVIINSKAKDPGNGGAYCWYEY